MINFIPNFFSSFQLQACHGHKLSRLFASSFSFYKFVKSNQLFTYLFLVFKKRDNLRKNISEFFTRKFVVNLVVMSVLFFTKHKTASKSFRKKLKAWELRISKLKSLFVFRINSIFRLMFIDSQGALCIYKPGYIRKINRFYRYTFFDLFQSLYMVFANKILIIFKGFHFYNTLIFNRFIRRLEKFKKTLCLFSFLNEKWKNHFCQFGCFFSSKEKVVCSFITGSLLASFFCGATPSEGFLEKEDNRLVCGYNINSAPKKMALFGYCKTAIPINVTRGICKKFFLDHTYIINNEYFKSLSNRMITPPGAPLSATDIKARVDFYGNFVTITNQVQLTVEDEVLNQAARLLAQNLGQTVDEVTRDVLASTSSVYACANGSNGETPTELTKSDLDVAIKTLLGQDALMMSPSIDGANKFATAPVRQAFWGLMDTDLLDDLEACSNFQSAANYPQRDAIEGEWGATSNIRWLYTSVGSVSSASPAVYNNFVLAKEAYAIVHLRSESGEFYIKSLGSAGSGDPLNQRGSIGWQHPFVSRILNDNFMLNVLATHS